MCVAISLILDVRLVDAPAGVTQEEGHTGFLHLPSSVLALILIAIRIQPFLSLVDGNTVYSPPVSQWHKQKSTVTKIPLPIEIHVTLFGFQVRHKPTLLLYVFSLLCPILTTMCFDGYFLVAFSCLLALLFLLIVPALIWLASVYLVTTTGFVAD